MSQRAREDGVRVYDVVSGGPKAFWKWPGGHGAFPLGAALSPSGRTLVVATTGQVTAWDTMTGKKLGEQGVALGSPGVHVAFGDHETLVAIMGVNDLEFLWDTASGKVYRLDLETDHGLAIAATGRYIAGIGLNQGGLKVVRLPDLTVETRIPKKCGTVVTFAADGRHLLCAGGEVTRWDLLTGESATTAVWWRATASEEAALSAAPRAGHGGTFFVGVEHEITTQIAFSRDGSVIAAVSSDSDDAAVTQLWDVASKRRLAVLPYFGDPLERLAFSADGGMLVVTDTKGRITEIPVAGDHVAEAVCERAGRTLTGQEWEQYLTGVPYRDICPAA